MAREAGLRGGLDDQTLALEMCFVVESGDNKMQRGPKVLPGWPLSQFSRPRASLGG